MKCWLEPISTHQPVEHDTHTYHVQVVSRDKAGRQANCFLTPSSHVLSNDPQGQSEGIFVCAYKCLFIYEPYT